MAPPLQQKTDNRIKYKNIAYNGKRGCLFASCEKIMFRPDDSKTSKTWRWELIDRVEEAAALNNDKNNNSLDRVLRIVPKKVNQKVVEIYVPRHLFPPLLKDLEKRSVDSASNAVAAAKRKPSPGAKKIAEKSSQVPPKATPSTPLQKAAATTQKRHVSLPGDDFGIRVSGSNHEPTIPAAATTYRGKKYLQDDTMGIRISGSNHNDKSEGLDADDDDGIRVSGSNHAKSKTKTQRQQKSPTTEDDMGIRVLPGGDPKPIRKAYSQGSKRVEDVSVSHQSQSSSQKRSSAFSEQGGRDDDGIRVTASSCQNHDNNNNEQETPTSSSTRNKSKLSAIVERLSSPRDKTKTKTKTDNNEKPKPKHGALSGLKKPKIPPLFHKKSEKGQQNDEKDDKKQVAGGGEKAAANSKTPRRSLLNFLKPPHRASSTSQPQQKTTDDHHKKLPVKEKEGTVWTPNSSGGEAAAAAAREEDSNKTEPSTPSAPRAKFTPPPPPSISSPQRRIGSASNSSSRHSHASSNSKDSDCNVCAPISSAEDLPGLNPEWSPDTPENKTLLMMFQHAAACTCRNKGSCDMDPECSHHKAILDHMDSCENIHDCDFEGCMESKQFLTVMQVLMQEPEQVKNGDYDDFLIQAGALVPLSQIKFNNSRSHKTTTTGGASDSDTNGEEREYDNDNDDDDDSSGSAGSMMSQDDVSDLGSWGVIDDEYDGEDPWMSFQVPTDAKAFDIC